jgi:transposase InsO family protein
MAAAELLSASVGLKPACAAVGVSRASLYRRRSPAAQPRLRPTPPRALSPQERQQVLDVLNDDAFADDAPAQVHASLLDGGIYLCSVRTMYRVLAANDEVRERRDVLRHPAYSKPELVATAPNQVWSWDITKLKGPAKYTYFFLYVILDIFSRYVVGWMLAASESARLAKRLIAESCGKQAITSGQLQIHADRGAAMVAKTTAQLFADLGIAESHSRPHVSDDNPYSESQFKTLKYRPEFPDRFGSQQHALEVCRTLFAWYNTEHHHSALAYLTPEDVHYGRAAALLEQRQHVLDEAYAKNPERFVRARPKPLSLPSTVWINPPKEVPETVGEPH